MLKKLISLLVILVLAGSASAGLVAQYDFESDVTDSTANHYDGTATGTVGYVAGLDGGNAASFDGSNYVSLPTGTLSGLSDEVTIMFWSKNILGGDAFAMAFNGDGGANGSLSVNFMWNGSGGMQFFYQTPEPANYAQLGPEAGGFINNGGVWAHWAYVKDRVAGTMKIYKNGALATQGGGSMALLSAYDAVTIAATTAGTYGYVGAFDDFRIYNNALDLAGVQAAMAEMPEPATIALLGLGTLALIRKRRTQ